MNTTFTKLTATLALLFAAGSLTAGEKSSANGGSTTGPRETLRSYRLPMPGRSR